jgi:glycosyltransferase involved in cell wall biosynthesis
VEACIDSVIEQDYADLEILVCDGGSTDTDLRALLERYRPKVSYFDSLPDNGHAEAIRRGFSRSTGDLLTYLCSDDVMERGAVRRVVEAFKLNSDGGVFYGHSYTIDENDRRVGEKLVFPFNRYSFISGLPICQPATFWSRRAYQLIGENFGGDSFEYNVFEPQADLLYRLYSHRVKFVFVDHFLASDRRHPGCASFVISEEIVALSDRARFRAFPHLTRRRWLLCYKFLGRSIQIFYFLYHRRFIIVGLKIGRRFLKAIHGLQVRLERKG